MYAITTSLVSDTAIMRLSSLRSAVKTMPLVELTEASSVTGPPLADAITPTPFSERRSTSSPATCAVATAGCSSAAAQAAAAAVATAPFHPLIWRDAFGATGMFRPLCLTALPRSPGQRLGEPVG